MPRQPQRPGDRIYAQMRRRLDRGEYGPAGTQLPPITQLQQDFDAARGTIANVLRRLEADGLIEVVAGWGSFVR